METYNKLEVRIKNSIKKASIAKIASKTIQKCICRLVNYCDCIIGLKCLVSLGNFCFLAETFVFFENFCFLQRGPNRNEEIEQIRKKQCVGSRCTEREKRYHLPPKPCTRRFHFSWGAAAAAAGPWALWWPRRRQAKKQWWREQEGVSKLLLLLPDIV